MYPPTTSDSSAGDSFSKTSAGPSRKRCRSPAATVTSSVHVTGALVPFRTDLFPPHKRFRDFISPEDSVEEDINADVLEDIEADDVAVDKDVEAGVDAGVGMEVDVRVDVEDEVESSDRGTIEVGVDVVVGIDIPDEDIKTGQRESEARSLIDSRERANLLEQVASLERSNARLQGIMMMEKEIGDIRDEAFGFSSMMLFMDFRLVVELVGSSSINNMRITRFGMTSEAIEELVNQRVEEALAAYEATHAVNALEAESQSQNDSDGDNGNGGNRNGGVENGGDGNPNENNKGARPVTRECTYQDFMKSQPLNFKGTKGVVSWIMWFEKMEIVFHISNCPEKCQVKYATCTLLNSALTWWNSHKRTVGTEAAFSMSWRELMKLMAEVYFLRNEIQKMESELKNLTLKNNVILRDFKRNVIAVEPTRLQDVVRIASNLMDQKLKGYAVKNAENKRKLEVNQRDNRGQQPPFKRQNVRGQNVARAYMAGNNEKKGYAGPLPYCNKCADRSIVSTTFSTLIDITPDTLNVSYAVELADGRISETNTVLRGSTLGLLGHPFNIDLMPVELGSFDVIIGIDWLANHRAVIVCDEKIVQIPYEDDLLIV
ncbi:reverse transcriptase domain-containing protein [Tanacetum coccineum]